MQIAHVFLLFFITIVWILIAGGCTISQGGISTSVEVIGLLEILIMKKEKNFNLANVCLLYSDTIQ